MLKSFILSSSCISTTLSVARIHSIPSTKKSYYWLNEWRNAKELSKHLMDNILYRDDYMVAFNKPNGVPMYSPKYDKDTDISPTNPQDFLSVDTCKEHLIKELGVQDMHEILSQKRMYSGVTVFCFNEGLSKSLSNYFRVAKINKKCLTQYELICLGRNQKISGSMTIHIAQMMINNNVLSIENEGFKSSRKIKSNLSLLNYDTVNKSKIAFNCSASHLKVLTSSVKWDALELFAIKRMSPVLGDHRYSSRIRTILDKPVHMNPEEVLPEPQEVPKDICNLLEVNENMTEDIPLHIHCSKVILPRILKRRNDLIFRRMCFQNDLYEEKSNEENDSSVDESVTQRKRNSFFITAPPPPFFAETLKRLQLL